MAKKIAVTTSLQQVKTLTSSRRTEKMRKTSFKLSTTSPIGKTSLEQMSPESEERVKKLVSILATFTLITGTREEPFKTVKATKAGKNSKESKGANPENLA